jgi:cbb3-type cytochrome oxidase maturation protein
VEVIYLLIPISMLIVAAMVWVFLWAVRSGQFDDLEGPAYSILMDDDEEKSRDRAAKTSAGAADADPAQPPAHEKGDTDSVQR